MINPTKINQQSSLFFQEGRVKSSWILAAILLLGLALRILLLSMRWINPDEGAHLLDARLLLEGQVPVVDYGSRQPFYVLMIALFLKIFGVNYTAGRLLPLFSSLGVGWMLFLFGRRWKDDVVGLTAAGIYAFLPLVIVWSTIVKTEQLTILLGVISIYLVVVSANDKAWPLFLSGLFAGLAFYVRQPALYLPLAAVVFLAWRRRNVLKSLALYVGGYLVVCLAVAALYLPHMSFQDMLFSQLNPLNLIWNRFLHLFGLLPEQYRIVDEEGFRFLGQSMDYTLTAWHHSLSLCLFIILGALVMLRHKQAKRKEAEIQMLLVLWSGFCFLLYLYQTASRGFYTQYFTEALPALILLAAAAMKKMFADLKKKGMTIALGAPLLFVLLFLGQKIFPTLRPGMAGYFVLGLGLAALLEMLLNTSPADLRSIFWLLILLVLVGVSTVLLKKLGLHDLYRFVLVLAVAWSALYVLNLNAAIRLSPNRVLLLTGFVFAAGRQHRWSTCCTSGGRQPTMCCPAERFGHSNPAFVPI